MRRHIVAVSALLCLVGVVLFGPAIATAHATTGWDWSLQNGLPSNSLNCVSFGDATHLWSVGNSGTIVASSDGGGTWAAQFSGTQADFAGVSFANDNDGWAVGSASYDAPAVFATSDGGSTWNPQSAPSACDSLSAVDFVSATHGWAVGSDYDGNAFVMVTANGGLTWTQQSTPDGGGQLTDVAFADALHGCAIGRDGSSDLTLLVTSDGGKNWAAEQPTTDNVDLSSVALTDANHGCVVGYDNDTNLPVILVTTDGGLTWTDKGSQVGSDWQLNAVYFADDSDGWACGSDSAGPLVAATTDGGLTWTDDTPSNIANDQNSGLSALAFANQTHGCLVGNTSNNEGDGIGMIQTTPDGGSNWTQHGYAATSADLAGVTFPDQLHGWTVGSQSAIAATTDGGATWTPQQTPLGISWNGVDAPDASHCWAVGDVASGNSTQPMVYGTSSAGGTWARESVPLVYGTLSAVSFPNDSDGFAVGANTTTSGGAVLATTNGGQTWTAQDPGTRRALNAVDFVDPQIGWAVGNGGVIRTTMNGGATWTVQSSSVSTNLVAVDFIDRSRGWAVGYDQNVDETVVLNTTDGGRTWTVLDQPDWSSWPAAVAFADPLHGWIVANDGSWVTSDGGVTWAQQQSPCQSLTGLALAGGHAWAVGDGGVIMAANFAVPTPTPDTTSPAVTPSGASNGMFTNAGVSVVLSGTDGAGSGVWGVSYSLDGSSPTTVLADSQTVTIAAPADHSQDGLHTLSFWATDNAGNQSTPQTLTIAIDTTRPGPRALPTATVKPGHAVGLRYEVVDSTLPGNFAQVITIVVKNKAGKVMKTIGLKGQAVNVAQTAKFTVPTKWVKGTYHFYVTATDRAGNVSAAAATNKFVVN